MSRTITERSILVSRESVASGEPYDIVWSNIQVVDALFKEHARLDEVAPDALRSYYVDYYLSEVNNGGFSQFVYNTEWDRDVVRLVREGLEAVGARGHLAVFDRGAANVSGLGTRRRRRFFESDYFGDNAERDALEEVGDALCDLQDEEDLIELNAAWLRAHPDLLPLSSDAIQAEIARRIAAQPDRAERVAQARAAEPRFQKLIRHLCDSLGLELKAVTAGDPSHEYQGQPVIAWHFLTTDGSHYYLIDAKTIALMFDADSHEQVAQIDVPPELQDDEDE